MCISVKMAVSILITSLLLILIVTSKATTTCPSSCYCDEEGEYVSCVGDGLWDIPSNLPNTTIRLELRNYLASTLSVQDLQMVEELQELKLQQSHIEILENATFSFNRKLQRLDLSQNSLSSLSNAVFYGLQKLRFLDLSSNNISIIEESFVDLANLEILNLRDNRIPQLTTNTFIGLHKVQYLNLDANYISFVEVGTFQYLTNLAHLIISNNPLNTLSRLDFFGSRLQFIDISHVGLDRIPQSLTKFVRDLRLAKNNLTRISAGDFDSYPYLGLLVLDDNCVSEIENDALGRQEYLMRLWLNGNCLTKVPPNLPLSLLALYMEENKLTELHSYSFKGLLNLEQLFLQRNEIYKLDACVFCDLVSLKSLDLQANQLENLSTGIFANLSQLEMLDLSQNKLKVIDIRCFDGLSKLKTLQMSRVPTLVQLDEAMFDPLQSLQSLEVYDSPLLVHEILNSTRMLHGLRKVQELNIMHNRIINLRSDFPSFMPNLKVIKMSGNLWHCNKEIFWLTTWIKQSNVQFYSSYSIRCATPVSLQYKPMMMLTEDDFIETTTTGITTIESEKISDIIPPANIMPGSNAFNSTEISMPSSSEISYGVMTDRFAFGEPSDKPKIKDSSKILESGNSMISSTSLRPSIPTTKTTEPKFVSAYPFRYSAITETTDFVKTTTNQNPLKLSNDNALSEQIDRDIDNKESIFVDSTISETTHTTFTSSLLKSTTSYPLESSTVPSTISTNHNITQIQTVTTIKTPKSNAQSVSAQRTVQSSRLRGWTQDEPTAGPAEWNHSTTVIVSAIVATGGFLIVAGGLVTLITLVQCRHRYQPVKPRNMRRSSSISYYPQKDEVSIVTLTEGTVSLRTNSHHGLGNKLYYIMENGCGTTADATKEAMPDPQLQELLPQSTENANVF